MSKSAEITFPTDLPGIAQVGRQPILDRKRRTYGYELLYRADNLGPSVGMDGNQATARTVLNTFMEFGLDHLAGDRRVFINLTRTFFTHMAPLPLDKERLVLEVLEDIEIDTALIDGIARMHKAGYTLALDDYRFEPRWEPLMRFASVIKVDIRDLDLTQHLAQIAKLKQRGLTLLAEKVETQAEFAQTRDLGFDLFQGYFFAKPQIVSGQRLDSNSQLLVRLLSRINDPNCQIEELSQLVSQDPNLSFKILRYINSAATSISRRVTSIQQAVVYIGLAQLRSWASLFAMAGQTNATTEIIITSLVRAELCQRLCKALSDGDPDCAYTVGLLSILDGLTDHSMAMLASSLGLPAPMIEALVAHSGVYGRLLSCALALEKHQWLTTATQILPVEQLSPLYIDALTKAEEIRLMLN